MPGSKVINNQGHASAPARRRPKRSQPEARTMGTGTHAIAVQPTHIPMEKVRVPTRARLAVKPTGKDIDKETYTTVQATHNLMTNRMKKEVGDKVLLNLPVAVQSEVLEQSVSGGEALSEGCVANLLWNIPGPHVKAGTGPAPPDPPNKTVFDTRGNMQKLKSMGFTVKNTFSGPIWVHANTPVCKSNARETVIARLCGFYSKGKRVECVYLEPGQIAKYTMPMAALTPGQAFSEFIEAGGTAEMALGRTMMIAQILVERPTDAPTPTGTGPSGLRVGGVAASVLPYVTYDYTQLEMEFKQVQDGEVVHVQPYTVTYSDDLNDLYGVTSTVIAQSSTALKKKLLGVLITLQHCEDNHLRMIDDETGKIIDAQADGVMMTVPALGIVRDGILECQFKGFEGCIYLWDTELDQPLEVAALTKRPVGVIGDGVTMEFALDTVGVYNINWGAFLENAGAAAWEIAKEVSYFI